MKAQASLAGKEFSYSLADALKKGPVVVYFYPSAYTQGCNIQAHTFAENMDKFNAAGSTVIGVSLDSIARLNDFSADPANAALVKAFADKKRDANGPFQMPAYAAVKIIGDAIAGTKSTDPTKVAAYMHKNAFTTPIGKVEYDAKGDLKSFKFVVYTWHKDATKTAAN